MIGRALRWVIRDIAPAVAMTGSLISLCAIAAGDRPTRLGGIIYTACLMIWIAGWWWQKYCLRITRGQLDELTELSQKLLEQRRQMVSGRPNAPHN